MPLCVGRPLSNSTFPTRASTLGGSLSGKGESLPSSCAAAPTQTVSESAAIKPLFMTSSIAIAALVKASSRGTFCAKFFSLIVWVVGAEIELDPRPISAVCAAYEGRNLLSDWRPTSALGQKQTCAVQNGMSALPLKADLEE